LIDTKMKEGVDPLKSTITDLKEKNLKQEKHIDHLTAELKKVDAHYMNCCRAICATQGLVLKDVSGHEI
jgi:hypothetical protein